MMVSLVLLFHLFLFFLMILLYLGLNQQHN